MALPTKTDLQTMDYCYLGQPFVYVHSKNSVDTATMNYCYLGEPFIINPEGASPPPARTYAPCMGGYPMNY